MPRVFEVKTRPRSEGRRGLHLCACLWQEASKQRICSTDHTRGSGAFARHNGSSFAGLFTNPFFHNMVMAAAMADGEVHLCDPAAHGCRPLTQKKRVAPTAGSVPTYSPRFVGLLVGIVLIMGGLAYFPTDRSGP